MVRFARRPISRGWFIDEHIYAGRRRTPRTTVLAEHSLQPGGFGGGRRLPPARSGDFQTLGVTLGCLLTGRRGTSAARDCSRISGFCDLCFLIFRLQSARPTRESTNRSAATKAAAPTMAALAGHEAVSDDLMPIALGTLRASSMLAFDLYLPSERSPQPVLYRQRSHPFAQADLDRLIERGRAHAVYRLGRCRALSRAPPGEDPQE